jgi:alkylation response protein AidB-like acyl-CoA dehydrogenase
MCRRARERVLFRTPLATRANVQDWIAEPRIELEMIRLLTLKTAWLIDRVGNKHARTEIAAIKVAAPSIALRILDRAIQLHGGAGVRAENSPSLGCMPTSGRFDLLTATTSPQEDDRTTRTAQAFRDPPSSCG